MIQSFVELNKYLILEDASEFAPAFASNMPQDNDQKRGAVQAKMHDVHQILSRDWDAPPCIDV